jgi:2-polyprenyl-3-methyl-5-hydroxy-6-metoxy-1,4-benzoquinol methylase
MFSSSLVDFSLDETFDVVMSDNVLEHLTPSDMDLHLMCIRKVLRPGGSFIALTPNRLFGPWDVTRILDYSYSGRTPAQGTHVNEMTHEELRAALLKAGFSNIKSLFPRFPVANRFVQRIRLPVNWMVALEQVQGLVQALQRQDKRRMLQAFEIALIAEA